jgi:hypothetical protein
VPVNPLVRTVLNAEEKLEQLASVGEPVRRRTQIVMHEEDTDFIS